MNARDVRYGSLTDISRSGFYVCFTPNNGREIAECPLSLLREHGKSR
jgi:hypothetical protein